MGVSKLLLGRRRRLFRPHRFNARLLRGSATLLSLAGLTTLVLLLV
jgi:hypothetical protein